MKRQNLTAIRAKRFVPQTTNSNHEFGYSPNLLKETANTPSEKGAVLVGDITYLPLSNGKFCYPATFQDNTDAPDCRLAGVIKYDGAIGD